MAGRHFIDIEGQRFGRLVVLEEAGRYPKNGEVIWLCRCDCGELTEVRSLYLRKAAIKSRDGYSRGTTSCGCYYSEMIKECNTTHGKSSSPAYHCWQNIISRCYYKDNKAYKHYGAKGIKVFKAWLLSFDKFYADVGDPPGPKMWLTRINKKGNYKPDNVVWETPGDVIQSRPVMSKLTVDQVRAIREEYAAGKTTQRALAKKYGMHHMSIYDIIARRKWKNVV